jgi:L-serine dehydratase
LVEVPCVKRNVIGAVNAVTAADMVMAGVISVIPGDEVIDVMGEIGNEMPKKYKETAEGGLATCPTAVEITKNLPH